VAVKLLRDEYAHDPSFVTRLRAEACHGAAVTHPGVASVFDYGEVTTGEGAPTPFLVMELVAGSRCRGCWLGRDAWGWTGSSRSSARPRWRSGRPIGPGWSTGTSSRPTCSSAPTVP
jgi:hypothetical protein